MNIEIVKKNHSLRGTAGKTHVAIALKDRTLSRRSCYTGQKRPQKSQNSGKQHRSCVSDARRAAKLRYRTQRQRSRALPETRLARIAEEIKAVRRWNDGGNEKATTQKQSDSCVLSIAVDICRICKCFA